MERSHIIILVILLIVGISISFFRGPKKFEQNVLTVTPIVNNTSLTDDPDGDTLPNWLEEIIGTETETFDDIDNLKQELLSDEIVIKNENSPNAFYEALIASAGTKAIKAERSGIATEGTYDEIANSFITAFEDVPLPNYEPNIQAISDTEDSQRQFLADLGGLINTGFNALDQTEPEKHAEILRIVADTILLIRPPQSVLNQFTELAKYLEFMARVEEEKQGAFANSDSTIFIALIYTHRYYNEIGEALASVIP